MTATKRQTNLRLTDEMREQLLIHGNRNRQTMSDAGEMLLALGFAAYAAGWRAGDTIPPKTAKQADDARRQGRSLTANVRERMAATRKDSTP